MACIGSCLPGAIAISHDFFSFRISVSSWVGCLRAAICEPFCLLPTVLCDEYSGGSGMLAVFLVRDGGGLLRRIAQ